LLCAIDIARENLSSCKHLMDIVSYRAAIHQQLLPGNFSVSD
jgi:hypothetical protein